MIDMQKILDGINEANRIVRSGYHLTLGKMITALEASPAEFMVAMSDDLSTGPGKPMSYRGYYSDLAFGIGPRINVAEFLAVCRSAFGTTFEGYKGGDFLMGADTPLWVSEYGDCSDRAVVGAHVDAALKIVVLEIRVVG